MEKAQGSVGPMGHWAQGPVGFGNCCDSAPSGLFCGPYECDAHQHAFNSIVVFPFVGISSRAFLALCVHFVKGGGALSSTALVGAWS